jgi:hypothetical protein
VRSFSYEWNRWDDVQLDMANGRTESEETFVEKTDLTPEDVRVKLVLDVSCSAGRFLSEFHRQSQALYKTLLLPCKVQGITIQSNKERLLSALSAVVEALMDCPY